MEKSRFNVEHIENNRMILFNTYTGALVELDQESTNYFQNEDYNNLKYVNELKEMGFLVNNRIDEWKKVRDEQETFIKSSETLSITILPTTSCNLRCTYCFESIRNVSMSDEVINRMVDFLKSYIENNKYTNVQITWFGGEPLLNIDLNNKVYSKLKILFETYSLTIQNYIITNGTLLDDKAFEFLSKLDNLKLVQITLDGSKMVHDERRPLKNGSSFDLIIDNLVKYIGKLPILVRVNIDKVNIKDIDNLLEYLSEFSSFQEKLFIDFAKVIGDWSDCYTSKEFTEKRSDCRSLLLKHGFINSLRLSLPHMSIVQCTSLTKHHIAFDSNGDLYNCWQKIGIKDYCIGNVYDGLVAPRCTLKSTENEECFECNLYPICHSGCPIHYKENEKVNCVFDSNTLMRDLKAYIDHYVEKDKTD